MESQDKEKQNLAAEEYPGVAIDIADKDEVTECEMAERTKTLDNNPQSQEP